MIMVLPEPLLKIPFAHRGYHDVDRGYPENSLSAVQAAIDAGYGIEIDVQLSSDGEAVVFHDEGLSRLTRMHGFVRERSASTLRRIPLLGGNGEGVPLVTEVLDRVNGRVPLLIELKSIDDESYSSVGRLETAIAHTLKSYVGPVGIMSFSRKSIAAMGAAFASVGFDWPLGLTTSASYFDRWLSEDADLNLAAHMRVFMDLGVSFLGHESSDLGRSVIQLLRAKRMPVLAWTVTSYQDEHAIWPLCDNIIFEGFDAQQRLNGE